MSLIIISMRLSQPFDFLKRHPAHLEQQPAVSEAADICRPVRSCVICHRHFDDLEVLLYRSENKVKVPKGVEITEIRTVGRYQLIVFPAYHFRAAKRVSESLAQQPAKQRTEKLVSKMIDKTHCLLFHWIDEPRAVNELAFTVAQRPEEFRQIFRRGCQVRILDNQHVCC